MANRENTDASIHGLLDDLIDSGFDVIHPVQVAVKDMDSGVLAPTFGERVGYWGGVDSQQVLPHGTPEEVKAEVRQRISDFAPGGGYMLAAMHNIQHGGPMVSLLAMYEAGIEYGHYPISRE